MGLLLLSCPVDLDQRLCQQKVPPLRPPTSIYIPQNAIQFVGIFAEKSFFSPNRAPNFLLCAKGPGHIFRISLLAFTPLQGKSQQDRNCALFNSEPLKHSALV